MAYIKGSNTEAFDQIGSAVALSRDGRTLVATALGEDGRRERSNGNQADNSAMESGAAYVFGITAGYHDVVVLNARGAGNGRSEAEAGKSAAPASLQAVERS